MLQETRSPRIWRWPEGLDEGSVSLYEHLSLFRWFPVTPTYSQYCLVKCLKWIFAEYIQLWDQNYLSYGVQSQAFFDVVSIALRLTPTRDDLFSGLESLTLIAHSCNPKLSPAGLYIPYSPSRY